MHQLTEKAWQQEIMPKQWCGSIIAPIHKKGKRNSVRTIKEE